MQKHIWISEAVVRSYLIWDYRWILFRIVHSCFLQGKCGLCSARRAIYELVGCNMGSHWVAAFNGKRWGEQSGNGRRDVGESQWAGWRITEDEESVDVCVCVCNRVLRSGFLRPIIFWPVSLYSWPRQSYQGLFIWAWRLLQQVRLFWEKFLQGSLLSGPLNSSHRHSNKRVEAVGRSEVMSSLMEEYQRIEKLGEGKIFLIYFRVWSYWLR